MVETYVNNVDCHIQRNVLNNLRFKFCQFYVYITNGVGEISYDLSSIGSIVVGAIVTSNGTYFPCMASLIDGTASTAKIAVTTPTDMTWSGTLQVRVIYIVSL